MVAIKHSENANPAQRRTIQSISEKGNTDWQMIVSPPLTPSSSVHATGSRTTRRGNDLHSQTTMAARGCSAAFARSKLHHHDGRARVVKRLLLTNPKRGIVAVPSTGSVALPPIAGPSAGPIAFNDTSATATALPLRSRKHRPARLSLVSTPNSITEPILSENLMPTQDVENAYIDGSNSLSPSGMPSASDVPMRDSSATPAFLSSTPGTQRPALKTPPSLPKPELPAIDTSVLAKINPELENIPLDYIQKMIWREGATLLSLLSHTSRTTRPSASNSTSVFPSSIDITLPHVPIYDSWHAPSHMFALYTPITPSPRTGAMPLSPSATMNGANAQAFSAAQDQKCTVTLFPAHQIVFAAQCANLPPLDLNIGNSRLGTDEIDVEEDDRGKTITLPIIPLRVPHSETFSTLAAFLYTRRADVLIRTLLQPATIVSNIPSDDDDEPVRGRTRTRTPRSSTSSRSRQSSSDINDDSEDGKLNLNLHFTPASIRACTMATYGLYMNMLNLGVDDSLLWSAVRYVWDVVCDARLNSAAAEGGVTA